MKRKLLVLLIPVFILLLSFNNENKWFIKAYIDGKEIDFSNVYADVKSDHGLKTVGIYGYVENSPDNSLLSMYIFFNNHIPCKGTFKHTSMMNSGGDTVINTAIILDRTDGKPYMDCHSFITITSIDSNSVSGIFEGITAYGCDNSSKYKISGKFNVPLNAPNTK